MGFKLVARDSHIISGQWRLASVAEVKSHFNEIKSQEILGDSSIARLLDGWVAGSGYGYKLEQDYRDGMSDMLIVSTNTLRPSNGSFDPQMYSGVELSAEGRKAALLLSADDKITEVDYFVLYLFAQLENLVNKIKKDLGCDCNE
ncbi:hypothetical protein SUGI_1179580 [Cryptomeria japonica]|nr:hypothetical protein SUGI_1179580 [Cryptomeria japonica]